MQIIRRSPRIPNTGAATAMIMAVVGIANLCVLSTVAFEKPKQPGGHVLIESDLLTQVIAEADKWMSSVKRSGKETPNFVISSDVTAPEVVDNLAASLEGAYFTINQVLDLPISRPKDKVRVYFFEDYRQHQRVMGPSGGAYLRPGLLTFYQGKMATQELLDVLVHETTHAFVDRFLVKEHRLPMWLSEGFASYMGRSIVIQGSIQPGLFYTVHRRDFLNRFDTHKSQASEDASSVSRRIKNGPLISLDELIAADRSTFYGINSQDHYKISWAFVHFLRHGVEGGEERLPKLVAAYLDGSSAEQAFEQAYGQGPAELEPAFHTYVTKTLSKPKKTPREILNSGS